MNKLKIVAIAMLLSASAALTACDNRNNDRSGTTPERSTPGDAGRAPGSPTNPGNP
jgi:hypothetical protein